MTLGGTIMPIALIVVGLAAIVRTAAEGAVLGVILGVMLVAAGGLRLYLERRR